MMDVLTWDLWYPSLVAKSITDLGCLRGSGRIISLAAMIYRVQTEAIRFTWTRVSRDPSFPERSPSSLGSCGCCGRTGWRSTPRAAPGRCCGAVRCGGAGPGRALLRAAAPPRLPPLLRLEGSAGPAWPRGTASSSLRRTQLLERLRPFLRNSGVKSFPTNWSKLHWSCSGTEFCTLQFFLRAVSAE